MPHDSFRCDLPEKLAGQEWSASFRISANRVARRSVPEDRGQPLRSLKVIVNLIAGTTTKKGLKVHAEIDGRNYPTGIKVPDRTERPHD
jgi:hypothetical protein